ncbi:DNA-3-methyladenine glycosylase [Granulicella sp. L60]|uniref:DNA-3-methyladenine glycosylase n=1 Tax=Granulicella sp. L60 TaxID=1641866 RepID=UPI0020B12C83|nr:DNA-3-methyladenine glycosylase [Granulicella sp. L60]
MSETMKRRRTLLPRTFYEGEPAVVAKGLVGKLLVRRYKGRSLVGRILETEAYLGKRDPASHTYRGKSAHNSVLFGPPGFTYVYFIYGLHYCLNVSSLPDGQAGGVLIRAFEPIDGVAAMARMRCVAINAGAHTIAGGPGKVCQALNITRVNGHGLDVTSSSSKIQIQDDGFEPNEILVTKRIGITKAVDLPLRFLMNLDSWARGPVGVGKAPQQ